MPWSRYDADFRRRWAWRLSIATASSNSVANYCESLRALATSAKDRSGHSTAEDLEPN